MKTQVFKRLKQSPEEYAGMVMNLWLTWCSSKTNNTKSLQKVLTCQPLFNWWQRELKKLEAQFMEETEVYRNSMSKDVALAMYSDTTRKIFNKFSKPLMKKAHE